MTAANQPLDLDPIRRRRQELEDVWDFEYVAPNGPAKAIASAEDVPALLAEVARLRPVVDAAIAWRRMRAGTTVKTTHPTATALIDAVDNLTGDKT